MRLGGGAGPAGFRLEVEAAWRSLAADADPATVVAEWVAELPELAPYAGQLTDLVDSALGLREQSGASAVLPFAAPYGERLYHGVMFVAPAAAPDNDPAALAAAVRAEYGDEPMPDFYEVDEVTLDSGLPAVRVRQLVDLPLADAPEAVVMDTVRYAVPVPDSPEVIVLNFATQALGFSDALIGRADRLARSFTFSTEDPP
ncbi:MAG: hypothetical protein ACJ73S_03835 [Mycobacteriales bacterium]